jgi:hypothetical protein
MRLTRRMLLGGAGAFAATPAIAQVTDLLLSPKTLVDRALEARSFSDIAKDNEIVVKVNAVMAKIGTISASTEIYEQRLLVTGLFDDKAKYDQFETGVRGVAGIKKLYWHAVYLSDADQKADPDVIGWAKSLELATLAKAKLIGDMDVHDINYRVCCDSFATIYLLGRALSKAERDKAVAHARDVADERKLVDLVVVRPKPKN